ncbi:hypothetical protein ART_1085 [Arthrobacter sp. PAMC 25486]|nr:hypothetical protein ART_1085 [Arthrobacter sp. PAMC 25486]
MATSTEEMLAKHPFGQIAVEEHKKRMFVEVRGCLLREQKHHLGHEGMTFSRR